MLGGKKNPKLNCLYAQLPNPKIISLKFLLFFKGKKKNLYPAVRTPKCKRLITRRRLKIHPSGAGFIERWRRFKKQKIVLHRGLPEQMVWSGRKEYDHNTNIFVALNIFSPLDLRGRLSPFFNAVQILCLSGIC